MWAWNGEIIAEKAGMTAVTDQSPQKTEFLLPTKTQKISLFLNFPFSKVQKNICKRLCFYFILIKSQEDKNTNLTITWRQKRLVFGAMPQVWIMNWKQIKLFLCVITTMLLSTYGIRYGTADSCWKEQVSYWKVRPFLWCRWCLLQEIDMIRSLRIMLKMYDSSCEMTAPCTDLTHASIFFWWDLCKCEKFYAWASWDCNNLLC